MKNSPDPSPSLEQATEDLDSILKRASELVHEAVTDGQEEGAIYRLGRYKMDVLQPLLGNVHYETGDNSLEERGTTEYVLDDEAENKINKAIGDILHRVAELEARKRAKAA